MIEKLLAISLENEEWKPVVGYEEIYQVSNIGRVAKIYPDFKLLKPTPHKGYNKLILFKDKCRKRHAVHRLVAYSFIPNTENKPDINHKNRIKDDNRVENLEWVTNIENNKHYLKSINWKPAIRQYKLLSVPKQKPLKMIYIYDKYGVFIGEHFGIKSLAAKINGNHVNINAAIKHNRVYYGNRYSYDKTDKLILIKIKRNRRFGLKYRKINPINKHLKGADHDKSKVFYKFNKDLSIVEELKGLNYHAKEINSNAKHLVRAIKENRCHRGFYYSFNNPKNTPDCEIMH